MQIDGYTIKTPYDRDDPGCAYDPDWRAQIATRWAANPAIITPVHEFYNDEYITNYRTFLKNIRQYDDRGQPLNRVPLNLGDKFLAYQYAYNRSLENSPEDLRTKLDALLLTCVPYSVIAEDLGGTRTPVEYIRTYERLFFNIRDKQGRLDRSSFLRTRFAMPVGVTLSVSTPLVAFWKMVGNFAGYDGLVRMWLWPGRHNEFAKETDMLGVMTHLAQNLIIQRLLMGTMNNFDIMSVMGHTIERERLNNEKGLRTPSALRSDQALADMIRDAAPKMLESALVVDQNKTKVKILAQKLSAARNVGSTRVKDMGREAAEEILNKMIMSKFENKK